MSTTAEKAPCVICLEVKEGDFAELPSCHHRFCLECIQQWAENQEQPLCPLCFERFDSVVLPNGLETSLELGTRTEEPVDAGFDDLDHSFFLGDVQRLLQRTQFLQQRVANRSQQTQLQEIINMLNSHRTHLEQRGDIHPSSLLQELISFDSMVTQITNATANIATTQSSGRRYGADDADCISSDDEHDIDPELFLCHNAKSYQQMRRSRSHLHPIPRPSKTLENGKSSNKRPATKSAKHRRRTVPDP